MSFIMLYSRPGMGKTTMACSFTKLGYKVDLIDVDDKASDMQNLRPLIDSGRLTIRPIHSKIAEGGLRTKILVPKAAHAKQPKGYLEFCDIMNEYEQLGDGSRFDSVLVAPDSLSTLVIHLEKLVLHLSPPSAKSDPRQEKFTYDQWDILRTNMHEVFSTLRSLQRVFKHVVVTAHEASAIDDETKELKQILPSLRGSFKNDYGQYLNEIWRLIGSRRTKEGHIWQLQTSSAPSGGIADARTSRNLKDVEPADFSQLFKGDEIK